MSARLTTLSVILCSAALLAGLSSPGAAQDRDGDGHVAMSAGGDDCDDGDASRFPGNAEVADRDSHDEDCDPTTFGFEDADGDGYPAAWACNVAWDNSAASVVRAGEALCGSDCNDRDPSIHPNQVDVCNNRDDNCIGGKDEHQPCDLLQRFQEDPDFTLESEEAARRRRRAMREQAGEAVRDAEREGRPVAQPRVDVPMQGGGDERACANAVQGKIAWNYDGTTRWADGNVERLCRGAETSTAPARCFQRAMHGELDKGDGSTRWRWQDALSLCGGTRDADATLRCFRQRVDRGASQQQAIEACSSQD